MKTNQSTFSTNQNIAKKTQMLGSSSAINMLNLDIDLVADSGFPVLICGEQGSGKKLVSSYIHLASKRAKQALITINCADFPEHILERELFGYAAGAFSGASTDEPGKYQLADHGTLFLNEIDALPLTLQAKLAKVIHSGELQHIGTDESNKFDVRLIAATSKTLAKEVTAGHFNDALYHRLTVYPLQVPSLRERGSDTLILAEHYLANIANMLDIKMFILADDAQQALLAYTWPGNTDELVDLLELAALTGVEHCPDGEDCIILVGSYFDIPASDCKVKSLTTKRVEVSIKPVKLSVEPEAVSVKSEKNSVELTEISSESEKTGVATQNEIIVDAFSNDNNLKQVTDDFQRQFIRKMLVENNGNSSATARAIGVDRSNLHRLMKRLEINC